MAFTLQQTRSNKQKQRLYQAKNRFESGFFSVKKVKVKNRNFIRNSIIIGSIVIGLSLAGIATFKNNDAYKVVDFESQDEIWQKLDLDLEQRKKIAEIDRQWQAYKNFEEEKIQIARTKLQKEINKAKPEFLLIDKYQGEIFDLELHIQQQKFNNNLEKRFVLEPEQSLKFVRESSLI